MKNDKELKLTAALYTRMRGLLDHVKRHGHLPDKIPNGGAYIAMRLLIRDRGTDITLTENEQLVYEAMLRENRLPGGRVILVY